MPIKEPFEAIEKIKSLYDSGKTQCQIAEMYGVTQALVSYHIRRNGIATRKNSFSPEAIESSKKSHPHGENHPGYKHVPIDEIAEKYSLGASSTLLAAEYGVCDMTIIRKLRSHGAKINKEGFSGWHTAKDGHRVQSGLELVVDNWLSDHAIHHITQPKLPFGTRNTRADFLVNNTYVEVLGLKSKKYLDKYSKKANLYKAHSLNVIYLYPKDIPSNLSLLEALA